MSENKNGNKGIFKFKPKLVIACLLSIKCRYGEKPKANKKIREKAKGDGVSATLLKTNKIKTISGENS